MSYYSALIESIEGKYTLNEAWSDSMPQWLKGPMSTEFANIRHFKNLQPNSTYAPEYSNPSKNHKTQRFRDTVVLRNSTPPYIAIQSLGTQLVNLGVDMQQTKFVEAEPPKSDKSIPNGATPVWLLENGDVYARGFNDLQKVALIKRGFPNSFDNIPTSVQNNDIRLSGMSLKLLNTCSTHFCYMYPVYDTSIVDKINSRGTDFTQINNSDNPRDMHYRYGKPLPAANPIPKDGRRRYFANYYDKSGNVIPDLKEKYKDKLEELKQIAQDKKDREAVTNLSIVLEKLTEVFSDIRSSISFIITDNLLVDKLDSSAIRNLRELINHSLYDLSHVYSYYDKLTATINEILAIPNYEDRLNLFKSKRNGIEYAVDNFNIYIEGIRNTLGEVNYIIFQG